MKLLCLASLCFWGVFGVDVNRLDILNMQSNEVYHILGTEASYCIVLRSIAFAVLRCVGLGWVAWVVLGCIVLLCSVVLCLKLPQSETGPY